MTPFLLAAMLVATTAAPEPLLPGIVDSPVSEVRPAFSPDGLCILWGAIDTGSDWKILQTCREGDGWSKPATVSFDSPFKDFDPAFSADGTTVYFFSDRPGGLGGDDLYAVERQPGSGTFGGVRNLGPTFNSAGNEWAPTPVPDGRVIFSSDGWPGLGGQDLFIGGDGEEPRNFGAPINGPLDDFDAVILNDDTVILTSGDLKSETGIKLFVSHRQADGSHAVPVELTAPFNCSPVFNNGPSLDPNRPGVLFYSAYCPEIGPGRMDIFSAPYPKAAEASK